MHGSLVLIYANGFCDSKNYILSIYLYLIFFSLGLDQLTLLYLAAGGFR